MPDFPHKIHAVEDSDGVTQEIVPLALQSGDYIASVPVLRQNETLALQSDIPETPQIKRYI